MDDLAIGLSDVKLQFTYDLSYAEAEQLAISQLAQVSSRRQRPSRKSFRGVRSARSFATGSLGRGGIQ